MFQPKFSNRLKDILKYSKEEAVRLQNDYVGIEHLVLSMLREHDDAVVKSLIGLNFDIDSFRERLLNVIKSKKNENHTFQPKDSIPLTLQADTVIRKSILFAKKSNDQIIDTYHLLMAILGNKNNFVTQLFQEFDIDDVLLSSLNIKSNETENQDLSMRDDDDWEEGFSMSNQQNTSSSDKKSTKSKTPVLDNFSRDITVLAREDKIDPIIGRDEEIERVSQILSRKKKNNPILIGEPGVGKTAIVEGLALRIVQKKVSAVLFDKRVVLLDVASLVAGTKFRGQFEERIKAIMNELEHNNDVILFIDEIHTIVGAGNSSGSLDASNMLKPAMARGEIQVIGASTLDEYRQYIEKDGALARRFQKVQVDPPTVEQTIQILENLKSSYEKFHNVVFSDNTIETAVRMSDRYITDRFLPDKAIDIIDEVGARVNIKSIHIPDYIQELEKEVQTVEKDKKEAARKLDYYTANLLKEEEKELRAKLNIEKQKWDEEIKKNKQIITTEHIASVISMMTGIPVSKVAENESIKLKNLSQDLKSDVIGQDDAIATVVKSIQRNRIGLKNPNKPIGVFVFLGPTGVGKTELAKSIAKRLFESEDALVRIDMSEYMEKFSISRLVGAPPGYVGYEEGGLLTEKVRRKPYSVVLLDEIEKAHPEVFNLLLQVFDDGILTDGLGRRVDFKNTLIIMTSNVGVRDLKDFGQGVGFATKAKLDNFDAHTKSVIEKSLKKTFAPEFLNRIDDIVLFNSLQKDDIKQIVHIILKGLLSRMESLGYKISVSDTAIDFICEKGYDIQFGARPLHRAVQKYIEDVVAEAILDAQGQSDLVIEVDFDEINQKTVASTSPIVLEEMSFFDEE